jgi:hypothetical protein
MQNISKIRNKIVIAALVLSVVGAGVLGVNSVSAQSTGTTSLVQKIAQKFNLNQSDVQAVFDQDHQDRHAQMAANYETQLSQYVTDGKITEAQKQLVLAKHKEMETNRETEMQIMQNWAKENNIDLQYLMPHGGKGMHKKFAQ